MAWIRLHNLDDQGICFPSRSSSIEGPIIAITFTWVASTSSYIPDEISLQRVRQAVNGASYDILWSGHGSTKHFQAPKAKGSSKTAKVAHAEFASLLALCHPKRIIFFSCWGGLAAKFGISQYKQKLGANVTLNGPDVKLMGAQIALEVKRVAKQETLNPWKITDNT